MRWTPRTLAKFGLCPKLASVAQTLLPVNGGFAFWAADCRRRQNGVHDLLAKRTSHAWHKVRIVRSYPVMVDVAQAIAFGFLVFVALLG